MTTVLQNRALLSPAVNLFTVGTKRDGDKWPARDRRKDTDKLDRINFPVFSPLTAGRMLKGLAELKALNMHKVCESAIERRKEKREQSASAKE